MVLLNKCCYCCDLRTGGIILGWLGMISSIFQIIVACICINVSNDYNPTNVDQKTYNQMVYIISSIIIGFSTIYLVINIALMWGSHKGQRFLLVPWLFTVGILLVVAILAVLIGGGVCFANDSTNVIGIVLYIIYLPVFVLQIYFWCCVLSLYQRLRQEEFVIRDDPAYVSVTTTTNAYSNFDI